KTKQLIKHILAINFAFSAIKSFLEFELTCSLNPFHEKILLRNFEKSQSILRSYMELIRKIKKI
ncbi:hypothetical protein BpHYR1_028402, partial [Brachionus plicatilis]